jgi:hypothetical protein
MSHSVTCGRECHDIAEAEADKKQKQIAKAVPPEEPPAQALPAELEFPEFRDSWERWAEYRKQARIKPYTKIGAAAQLKKLAELGKDRAIAAIENSIANAYQGIFEPKQGGNGHAAQKMEYVVGRGMVPIKK